MYRYNNSKSHLANIAGIRAIFPVQPHIALMVANELLAEDIKHMASREAGERARAQGYFNRNVIPCELPEEKETQ